jgi:hypothetical protein
MPISPAPGLLLLSSELMIDIASIRIMLNRLLLREFDLSILKKLVTDLSLDKNACCNQSCEENYGLLSSMQGRSQLPPQPHSKDPIEHQLALLLQTTTLWRNWRKVPKQINY